MVELALVGPMLVVLVLGIVDFGGFLQAKQNMITITRSGARYASLHPDVSHLSTSDTAAATTVQGLMQAEAGTNYTLPNSDIVVDFYDNSSSSPGTLCGEFTHAGGYTGKNGYASSGATCLEQAGQTPRLLKVTVTYTYSSIFPLLAVFSIPVTITQSCWMLEVPS
jgi:Flp pilus assembly protein TadG